MREGKFAEIAAHAVRIESRTNLLFSFEKIALRDAVKSAEGARSFAEGLRGGGAAKEADASSHLASGDRFRVHRAARDAYLP
jgi:hypothetical protein